MSNLAAVQEPRVEAPEIEARNRARSVATRINPLRFLARLERYLDRSEATKQKAAVRLHRALGVLFAGYAVIVELRYLERGAFSPGPIVLLLLAASLFVGRGGRFIHYFVPVAVGAYAYGLAGRAAAQLKHGVYYAPQIDFDRWLPGPMPTLWLQEHLYHGKTGVLELFAVGMYISHFFVPLLLGFALAMAYSGRAFARLMFGLLVVSILGEITFVLAPTAPPWLAAEHGYLPPVHHILKTSFYDLHLTTLGDLVGDPDNYDVTAAVPSLHVAFPVLGLLTARLYGLPRWVIAALAINTAGVVFSIVYLGDHFLFDALAGAAYAAVAWWLVGKLLGADGKATDDPPAEDAIAVGAVPATES